MMAAVMAACIAALASIVCQLMINRRTQTDSARRSDQLSTLVAYRIDQLEQKVNRLNDLIERTALLERDVKNVYCRISELKKEGEHGIQ